jgi:hypothetical protein
MVVLYASLIVGPIFILLGLATFVQADVNYKKWLATTNDGSILTKEAFKLFSKWGIGGFWIGVGTGSIITGICSLIARSL